MIHADGSHELLGQAWFIDVHDDFENRFGAVNNTDVDSWQVGFVPPVFIGEPAPCGPLDHIDPTGALSETHGHWIADAAYLVDEGQLGLAAEWNGDTAVATLPWRITPDLQGNYVVDAVARVALGERVTIGFIGEASAANGMFNDEYGQLTLSVTRVDANSLESIVKWDTDGDNQETNDTFITLATLLTDVPDTELRLQLALDETNGIFDTRIDGTRLLAGSLGGTPRTVFGVGAELTGTGSYISSFASGVHSNTAYLDQNNLESVSFGANLMSPVPEPGGCVLLAMALLVSSGLGIGRVGRSALRGPLIRHRHESL